MDMIQTKYKELYKSRLAPNVATKGKKVIEEKRKVNRDKLLMQRRKISPDITAAESHRRSAPNAARELFEKLKSWKEKKLKIESEKKAAAKPIFKVHHISIPIGMANLENINRTIKGKPFNMGTKTKAAGISNSVSKKANYKFVPKQPLKRQYAIDLGFDGLPGENIPTPKSPIGGIATRLRSRTKVNGADKRKNGAEPSSSNKQTVPPKKKLQRGPRKAGPENHNVEEKENVPKVGPSRKRLPPKKRSRVSEEEEGGGGGDSDYRSPKKKLRPNPAERDLSGTPPPKPVQSELANSYISPFVTISRGKSSARKEFQMRSSQGGLFDVSPQYARATGSEAGAAHFHRVLDEEIARIEKMCADWVRYKDERKPLEEACDMINVAVGQSNLLMSKKFKQFRSLIEDCHSGSSERPVTCADLHGYWETTYLQVENVNKRFENLEKLRENNWQEIVPNKEVVEKPQKKKNTANKAKVKATSSLKDMIRARREEVKQQATEQDETPSRRSSRVTLSRKSFMASVIRQETRRPSGSPGLVMMRASLVGKRKSEHAVSAESTPARSILKTPHSKSTRQKSVLFKTRHSDGVADLLDDITPPIADTTFELISSTGAKVKNRRSSRRLTKTKLSYDDQ